MKKINVGIVGLGSRGSYNTDNVMHFDYVNIVAVCDLYEDRVNNVIENVTKAGRPAPLGTCDYHDLLNNKDIDTILVFSSWESHIQIAIDAMRAGKAVGMEVGGAYNINECYELVDTWEETKMPFMMLENCCFGKNELLVQNLVRQGLFGDIVHCHGAYAHDLREEVATGKEKRHYRLKNYIERNCENYPTHELGPIAKILDINRGNRMVKLVSLASKSMGLKRYVADRKDTIENKDLLNTEFNQADIVETLIQCENGETISLKLDTTLPRSYSREFTVRGTKGMYDEVLNSVFLDGDTEYFETDKYAGIYLNSVDRHYQKYLPDSWKNITKEQIEQGHGGMDYFSFKCFFECLRDGKPMPVDVYDAASWMAITPLSEESIKNGCFVEIPDFTKGAWKTRERLDVEL